jgi:CRP/FNR family transcriptional regulator, cyclic AMP receptor protein
MNGRRAMLNVEIVGAIERSPWFQSLPGEALQRLASAAQVKAFKVKEYVYRAGEPNLNVYCVLSGRVRCGTISSLGHEATWNDQGGESWIGPALPIEEPSKMTIQAMENTQILALPKRVVLAMADHYPLIYRDLLFYEANNTVALFDIIESVLFFPLRSRLARRLLELAEEHGEELDGGVYLRKSVNQTDLALLCAGSRPRVNGILREWSDQGIVSILSGQYFIQDIDALQSECELKDE